MLVLHAFVFSADNSVTCIIRVDSFNSYDLPGHDELPLLLHPRKWATLDMLMWPRLVAICRYQRIGPEDSKESMYSERTYRHSQDLTTLTAHLTS